ncbi:MAG: MBL fold metallo-hydrolase [Acidimicrobiales bacterium]
MRWLRRYLWTPYAAFCRLIPLIPLHVVSTTVAPGVIRLSPENWFIRLLGRIGGYPYAVLYVVDDEVLIDTGFGWARKALGKYLTDSGLATSIETIVITHEHEDHFANAAVFSRLAGATVLAHPAAHADISHPSDARWYRSFLFGPHDPATVQIAPAAVETSHRTLSLLHTPGHTPGHLVALDREQGLLLAGDLFLDAELDSQLADADGPTWLRTLEEIATLDIQILADGHGTLLTGDEAQQALRRKSDFLRELRDAINAQLAAGPTSIQQITKSISAPGAINSLSYGEGRMSLLTANDFSRSNLVQTFVRELIHQTPRPAISSPNSQE